MLFKCLRYGAVIAALVATSPAQAQPAQDFQYGLFNGLYLGYYTSQPSARYIYTTSGWMPVETYLAQLLAQLLVQLEQGGGTSITVGGQNPTVLPPVTIIIGGGVCPIQGCVSVVGPGPNDVANANAYRNAMNALEALNTQMVGGARGTGGFEIPLCPGPNGVLIRCDEVDG
jgi:hypothetical protein